LHFRPWDRDKWHNSSFLRKKAGGKMKRKPVFPQRNPVNQVIWAAVQWLFCGDSGGVSGEGREQWLHILPIIL
jgi:hypothetical protein